MREDGSEINVVLIDWAGTITVPLLEVATTAAEHLGLDQTQMVAALGSYLSDDSPMHQAERGEISDDEMLQWMAAQAPGAEGLFDLDGPSLLNPTERPAMIELLEWLGERDDVMVVLATNNYVMAHDHLATRFLDSGLVDAMANSAMMGARKPEPEYFELILGELDVDPSEVVLVDDSDTNLAMATEFGMHTVRVGEDEATAIAALKALLA